MVPLSKATYQAPSISQPNASPVLQPSSSDPPNLQLWAGRIALTKTHSCWLELGLCPWYLRPCRERSHATFSESPSHSLHDVLNPLTALHPTTLQGWASNHTPASLADGNQLTLTQNSLHASQITNNFTVKFSFFFPLLNFRLLKDKIRI